MGANGKCYIEWREQFVSKERGKRVVHYFLKDISGESVLAVVGTERSIRHMFYVVSDEFLKVNADEFSVNAWYRWRSRREVVNWLTSRVSKQHWQAQLFKSPKTDRISGISDLYLNRGPGSLKRCIPGITWSGVAWTCGKQLKHFPAFRRNGFTVAVRSFAFVVTEEEKRHIAYIEDMYDDRKGRKKVKVQWFHHDQGVVNLGNPHPKEVFITPHAQVIRVECVDGPAIVLTGEHYDKCVAMLPEDLLTRVYLCSRQFKNNRMKAFDLSVLCGYFNQPIFSIFGSECNVKVGTKRRMEHLDCNVKVGTKRQRSLRGISRERFNMNAKYEMLRLRRKLIPKYVKNRGASSFPVFKTNDKIEALCQHSGIRGCWFRCTVLQVTRRHYKVQYDDLKDEFVGGNLEEWIWAVRPANPDKLGMRHVGRLTTRPARMEIEKNVTLEVGSPVDVWSIDRWWEGVVTEIDESRNGDVQVYVPSEALLFELHRKNIRVSRDWVRGRWVDVETKRDILSCTSPNAKLIKHERSQISPEEITGDFPEPFQREPTT